MYTLGQTKNICVLVCIHQSHIVLAALVSCRQEKHGAVLREPYLEYPAGSEKLQFFCYFEAVQLCNFIKVR